MPGDRFWDSFVIYMGNFMRKGILDFQGFYCNAEELFKTAKESRYLGPICAYQWRINVPKKKMKCSPFVLTN